MCAVDPTSENSARSNDEISHEHDEREDQQQVDQSASEMEADSDQPQN